MNYKIHFVNGETYLGGTIADSKWNDMPKLEIKKVTYNFIGHQILLEGYDAYNHIVERAINIQNGTSFISKILLMAKKGDKVGIIVFDISKRKVYSEIKKFGQEYRNKATTGWKEGKRIKLPIYKIT